MRGGASEERTVGRGPLDEEMAVVLPREPDAAEGLDRFATDEVLAVVGWRPWPWRRRWPGSRVSSLMAATAK